MFCPNCGKMLPDGAKFCTECGNPLPERPAPQAPEPQQTPVYQPQPQPQVYPSQPQTCQTQPQAPQLVPPEPEQPAPERKPALRDGRGKYILKRLIFCVAAIIIGIGAALVLPSLFPKGARGSSVPLTRYLQRFWITLGLTVIPLLISSFLTMLACIPKSNGGKNVFRVLSAVLRSLTPLAFAFLLIVVLAVQLKLLPVNAMTGGVRWWVMPVLTLTLPLTGFMMNAAVTNGHEPRFGASLGASASWAADHMPAIVGAVILVECVFSARGIGMLMINSIMQYAMKMTASLLILFVLLVYFLKFLLDIIAALASGGDPSELVFGARKKEDKSGNFLLVLGIICAGSVLLAAFFLPLFTSGDPAKMNVAEKLLPPGTAGHILGTDMYGRDLLSVIAHSLRTTVLLSLSNTIVACVLGIGFGVLTGFLKGFFSEIFKCVRYVFGFGVPFAMILGLSLGGLLYGLAPYVVIGLFSWGGIAERIGTGIKAKKAAAPVKTALVLPVLEQIVHVFTAAVFGLTGMSFLGLLRENTAFQTIGRDISAGAAAVSARGYAVLIPAAALIILLLSFFLLHAGLSASAAAP